MFNMFYLIFLLIMISEKLDVFFFGTENHFGVALVVRICDFEKILELWDRRWGSSVTGQPVLSETRM